MKNLFIGIVIGILAMAGIYGISLLFSSDGKSEVASAGARPSMPMPAQGQSGGVLDLICELHLDLDGQMALGIQGNEPSRITLAQIDMDKQSGWYQGRIAISESRGGTVTTDGSKFVVTRPALIQRFGTTITQESFTLDRSSGAFEQSLSLQDGRTVKLIRGTCAKVIKPPF